MCEGKGKEEGRIGRIEDRGDVREVGREGSRQEEIYIKRERGEETGHWVGRGCEVCGEWCGRRAAAQKVLAHPRQ